MQFFQIYFFHNIAFMRCSNLRVKVPQSMSGMSAPHCLCIFATHLCFRAFRDVSLSYSLLFFGALGDVRLEWLSVFVVLAFSAPVLRTYPWYPDDGNPACAAASFWPWERRDLQRGKRTRVSWLKRRTVLTGLKSYLALCWASLLAVGPFRGGGWRCLPTSSWQYLMGYQYS